MATTIKRKMPRDVAGLSDTEKTAARTGLGLASMATQAASAVAITGGSMAGVTVTGGTVSGLNTDLALADGGTGASTASAAVSNLGLSRALVTVDSIAALKALTITPAFSQVEVLGYSAAGDGGGGLFRYSSGSSATDDGGTIIQPTSGSGRWIRVYYGPINPAWFGAALDGVTVDTSAIAAALAVGDVTFPKKSFVCGEITIPSNRVVDFGGATLIGQGSTTLNVLKFATTANSAIKNLTIDLTVGSHPAAGFTIAAIYLSSCTDIQIENVTVKGGGRHHFFSFDTARVVVRNFISIDSKNDAFFIYSNCQDFTVSDSIIRGPQDDGFKVHGHNGVTLTTYTDNIGFSNCCVDYRTTSSYTSADVLGFEIWENTRYATLTGCRIFFGNNGSTDYYGISLGGVQHASASACVVIGDGSGIAFEAAISEYVAFSGCIGEDVDLGYSISNTGRGPVTITGGVIRGCTSYGCQIVNQDSPVAISGVEFVDVADRNIFLNSAGTGSTITGCVFISEAMEAGIVDAIFANAPVIISGCSAIWKNAVAGAFDVILNAAGCIVDGFRAKAGAATNANFVVGFGSSTGCIVSGIYTDLYSYNSVDSASGGGNWIIDNITNANGGNPTNPAGTDTVGNTKNL